MIFGVFSNITILLECICIFKKKCVAELTVYSYKSMHMEEREPNSKIYECCLYPATPLHLPNIWDVLQPKYEAGGFVDVPLTKVPFSYRCGHQNTEPGAWEMRLSRSLWLYNAGQGEGGRVLIAPGRSELFLGAMKDTGPTSIWLEEKLLGFFLGPYSHRCALGDSPMSYGKAGLTQGPLSVAPSLIT